MFNLVKKRSKKEEDLGEIETQLSLHRYVFVKIPLPILFKRNLLRKFVEIFLRIRSNCEAALRASKYRDVGAFTGKIGIPSTIAANTQEWASSWPCFLSRGGKSGSLLRLSPRYKSLNSFRIAFMLCDSQHISQICTK